MIDKILKAIKDIEIKYGVKIIHCVEAGSRAWGFASPDSDYDVRFVYIRPKNDYLKLNRGRDVIEYKVDDMLDMNGWDLDKALRLLSKSNPTLFEWNNSPIVYKTTTKWKKVSKIIDKYFVPRAGILHYLNMCEKHIKVYLRDEEVKLKKYMYAVRTILSCEYILDFNIAPPVYFPDLKELYLERGTELRKAVDDLLEWKTSHQEVKTGKRIDIINNWLDEMTVKIEAEVQNYPSVILDDWNELNNLFLSIIK